MNHLVISFITDDRPGLVDTLSNVVKQYNGNWQTSSMHHLSGFFAGVVELAVANEHCESLINAIMEEIHDLKEEGVWMSLKGSSDSIE